MQNNRVELLAPAGNTEGFYGAIHAGADAVYLGGSRFGARAYADNFTTEELVNCIRYAHLWDRKVYLTVNTLVKESEFSDIYDYLLPFYEAGLDGVIIQDIGVFAYIREHFPGLELHVSTQMTLTGEFGAKMLRDMGACRIVPARELSLEEIAYIKKNTGLSVETFIHGAMCYCYSGQCLFSSILGGRSGNRGRCAQPCRLPYEVRMEKGSSGECYPLSLKDMCTIQHIPELIEAGIDSFKIEGRMKKPEYTAGVTAIYRKYIDKYYKNIDKYDVYVSDGAEKKGTLPKFQIDSDDMKDLSCLYIRSERQDGYYYKHNGKDMITLDSPAYSGNDDALLARIRHDYLEQKPKKNIAVYADFTTANKAMVTFVLDDISITVEGDVVQTASKQPISEENISKQLSKLGDSVFAVESIDITVSDDAFYPLRAINELRREAVAELENMLIKRNGFPVCRTDSVIPDDNIDFARANISNQFDAPENTQADGCAGKIGISLRRKEQFSAVSGLIAKISALDNNSGIVKRIYLDSDLLLNDTGEVLSQCKALADYCELVIALPYIIRKKDYRSLAEKILVILEQYSDIFAGVQVRSLEGMGILKDKGYVGKIYTDAGFYIWNRRTMEEWKDIISGFCMPLELRGVEQKELLCKDIDFEKIIYGRIPMMITANCVANTTGGCKKNSPEKTVALVDRYRKVFPVELNCNHCMNIIYNSVPLSLHGELTKWKKLVNFRLDFTVESKEETEEVLQYFIQILGAGNADLQKPPYKDYTTGHEKRGVE